MVRLIIDGNSFELNFKNALLLKKQENTYFYGCSEHHIRTMAWCDMCKKKVTPQRIYYKQPTEIERMTEVKGEWADMIPLWAMVENGFTWIIDDENLKQKLIEIGKPIHFKYAERSGLNARILDNYIFTFKGHLARMRCDTENKQLIDYSQIIPLITKKKERKVNVLKEAIAK